MKTFKYRNLYIKYIQSGHGKPIIFLHNGGTSHVIWKDIMNELSNSNETFALDLLGYGSSSKPEKEYKLDTHVNILSEFIEHHQLENIILVGNCMGSAISIRYAMNNQEKVKSLVLFNPLTENTFTAGQLGSFLRLRKAAPEFSKTIYKGLGRLPLNKLISKQSLKMQFGAIGRTKKLYTAENLCACFTREGQMNALLLTLDDLVNYEVFDKFTPLEDFPPIFTIWGLENKILSAKAGQQLNTTLKPKREEWIAGGGHLVMLEKPLEIAEAIREFLTLT
ncbi:MAG TPA: alpha/beta hydrolase [Chitinophagales bacterium]|nr:alpha/beta hydrolase [Chitinophagales bacterium]